MPSLVTGVAAVEGRCDGAAATGRAGAGTTGRAARLATRGREAVDVQPVRACAAAGGGRAACPMMLLDLDRGAAPGSAARLGGGGGEGLVLQPVLKRVEPTAAADGGGTKPDANGISAVDREEASDQNLPPPDV